MLFVGGHADDSLGEIDDTTKGHGRNRFSTTARTWSLLNHKVVSSGIVHFPQVQRSCVPWDAYKVFPRGGAHEHLESSCRFFGT